MPFINTRGRYMLILNVLSQSQKHNSIHVPLVESDLTLGVASHPA